MDDLTDPLPPRARRCPDERLAARRRWADDIEAICQAGLPEPSLLDSRLATILGADYDDGSADFCGQDLAMVAIMSAPRVDQPMAQAILSSLSRARFDTKAYSRIGRGALHHAAYQTYAIGWVGALLAEGHDPHAVDNLGDTPLHDACARGNTDSALALLAHGAPLLATNNDGLTPEQISLPELAAILAAERERRVIAAALSPAPLQSASGARARL